jgi:hypothetical protein
MYGMKLRTVHWIVHVPSMLEVHSFPNKDFISKSITENSASSDIEGQNRDVNLSVKFALKHAFSFDYLHLYTYTRL